MAPPACWWNLVIRVPWPTPWAESSRVTNWPTLSPPHCTLWRWGTPGSGRRTSSRQRCPEITDTRALANALATESFLPCQYREVQSKIHPAQNPLPHRLHAGEREEPVQLGRARYSVGSKAAKAQHEGIHSDNLK